jgi:hypothetical protein
VIKFIIFIGKQIKKKKKKKIFLSDRTKARICWADRNMVEGTGGGINLRDDVPDGQLATIKTDASEGQQDAPHQHDACSEDGTPLACML